MAWLRGVLDRLLLLGGVIGGGLVPGFIAQYRQRLGGRLDQARLDLAAWQQIADQFHHGSLERLIQHHLASPDATFRAEGAVVRGLLASVQQLERALAALHGSLWQQATYLALHGDARLAAATWHDWVPTFALDRDGLLFAGLCGVLLWALFHALWHGAHLLRRRRPRARRATAVASP
ncbi:MAG: DUF2937 family protein [Gammaproteobacteria bacterium]|nr:DUF2937 family protein [Gammaproteobacteria bacterium]